jgi:hypothetical protein
VSQTVVLVKKENVLANRVPVGQTATYKLPDDADETDVWRRFRRDHPDENSMEWERKA